MLSEPPAPRTPSATTPARPHRALFALAAASLALVLAACESTGLGSASSDDSGKATRVITTAHGKVTVPTHPLRIVSVHSWSTETLLDLGVKPVGVENSGETYVPPRYLKSWKATPKATTGAELDYEKIAELKPDLIVGVDVPYLSKAYEQLSAIAPTALAPFNEAADWTAYPDATARFVNRTAQMATLKEKYEDRIAAVRTTDGAKLADSHWDVIQGGFDNGNYWIYSTASPVGTILTQLGAGFASATTSVAKGNTKSVSYERADLLKDADHVIYYTNNDGSPANNIQKLFALQSFKELPAVKKKQVVGTADFLPGSYMDALGMIDSVHKALNGQAS
ncbi:ABC transporter substrate-binding protein [Streptomyces sp. NPDC046984]|uniref:ABC transporter substrate-binding protein n=1 Tax=Streptomyces sp. NPDC046984 TaxID=3155138 RepID=UPI0033D4BD83